MGRILVLALAGALSFPIVAEVYTWKDDNGVTHFGNQPPPGQKNEQVEIKASDPGRPSASQSGIADQVERMQRDRKLRRLEQERERLERGLEQEDPEDSYSCEWAKERVEEYEIDLRELGRKGYKQWEKDRIESRLEEAERDAERDCN